MHMSGAAVPAMDLPTEKGTLQHFPAAVGITLCHVIGEEIAYTATARCSKTDNFKKAVGRKVALKHALEAHFARPQRALFWYEYFMALGHWDRAVAINQKWHCKPIGFEPVL